jgi:hypothetical protein
MHPLPSLGGSRKLVAAVVQQKRLIFTSMIHCALIVDPTLDQQAQNSSHYLINGTIQG